MVVFFLFLFFIISVRLIGIVKAGRGRMKGGREEKKRKEKKKKKGARCGDEDEIKGKARCS